VDTRPILIAGVIVVVVAAGIYFARRHRTSPLDGFAQCLGTKQAKMYGAFWCPHCAEQKELFDSAADYLPYIECGVKGQRKLAPQCQQVGIRNFPTWIFADGSRVEGKQSLEYLSQKTGCSLP